MAMVAVPSMYWHETPRSPPPVAPFFSKRCSSSPTDLPHLLSGVVPVLDDESTLQIGYESSGYQGERPGLSSVAKGRKSESRCGTFGKIPMVPGRVSNPGMAWFNKNSCEQLQQQLQENRDVSQVMDTLSGHVWDLSRHPLGCRLVQLALERGNQQQTMNLASELKTHVQEALTSPHANYVLQKIVTQLTWRPGASFVASELRHSAADLARHRFGCRIFCRLIEFHAAQETTQELVEEVLQEAEDLCCHPFGHHVAQAILEHGSQKHRDAVAATIDGNPLAFAKNQNASYLVERVLTSCSDCYQESLLLELSSSLVDLALSRYGCYVARAVVEHPKTDWKLETAKLTAVRQELNKTKHGQYLMADLGLCQKGPRKHK